jgi:hypothetical protein
MNQAKYTKDLMKKFNMTELKPVSTPMSTTTSLSPDEDGEPVEQREYDWLPPVPHGDTDGHSVHRVPLCTLLGLSTLFASDNYLADFQVSQRHTRVWDLVFCFFFTGSCWFFQ